MRLFLAVPVPPEVADNLSEAQRKLREFLPNARWGGREAFHLTLKFLGEVAPERLDDIDAAVRKFVGEMAAFAVELKGLGAFPSKRLAQVLWAGVDEGSDALSRLAENLESELSALGFEREKRDYRPHITLGRLKAASTMPAALKQMDKAASFGRFEAEQLDIMQSELRPQGPLYKTLRRCPFKERECPRA